MLRKKRIKESRPAAAPQIVLSSLPGKIFFLIVIALSVTSCSDEEDPITAQPPVFSETPVDIDYNPDDSSYGDIVFTLPVLTPFGISLGNERYSKGFEYFTVPGAPVRAVTDGIVDTIIYNEIEGDYRIEVISSPGAQYLVTYNHVNDVEVLPISRVTPGDTLGEAGNWNNDMRRFLLMVSLGERGNERFYCPLNYGDSAFVAGHRDLFAGTFAKHARAGNCSKVN